jgi:hypothetical protein
LFDLTVAQYQDFWKHIKENESAGKNYCYTFELVSPENRIVTPYAKRDLYLLTARDRDNDFEELDSNQVFCQACAMGVKTPSYHNFSDIAALVKMASNVEDLDEGFVCIDYTATDEDGNYRRIKVKNPAYLAISHLKESSTSSLRALLQVVMMGEIDEILGYFPMFEKPIRELEERWNVYALQVKNDIKEAEKRKDLPRRELALWAQTCENPGIIFLYVDGKISSIQDWIDNCITEKGTKNFGKKMMKQLKVTDIEWGDDA